MGIKQCNFKNHYANQLHNFSDANSLRFQLSQFFVKKFLQKNERSHQGSWCNSEILASQLSKTNVQNCNNTNYFEKNVYNKLCISLNQTTQKLFPQTYNRESVSLSLLDQGILHALASFNMNISVLSIIFKLICYVFENFNNQI